MQVAKEPMGTKGARLTSFVSLPGRHLVYTPTSNHIGISRRIESAQERQRLRAAVNELRPPGGFIVRTVCEGVSKREIQRDVTFLSKFWSSVVKQSETSSAGVPALQDLDVALRIVRDLFSSDSRSSLWCDDPETYQRIVEFVQSYMPRLRNRISLYEAEEPIFDHFHLEPQIDRALERKVWLKSGGYLVFDQAEAL